MVAVAVDACDFGVPDIDSQLCWRNWTMKTMKTMTTTTTTMVLERVVVASHLSGKKKTTTMMTNQKQFVAVPLVCY